MSLPTITIIGARIVEDVELRFAPSGVAVANFRIACNDRQFDKQSQEWKDGDTPTFLNCSVWRDQAENAAEQLVKGSLVNVYGRLKQRNYETKDGEKRTVYEVDVEEVSLSLKWKDKTPGQGQTRTQQPRQQATDPWGSPTQPRGQADPLGAAQHRRAVLSAP